MNEPPSSAEHSAPAPDAPEATPEETPDEGASTEVTTTGTLFVMLLFLMALAGMWVLVYLELLER